MFEHLFGEIGDDADLVAMVKKYAANGQSFDVRMARAVELVTVRHVPVREGSNSYYVHPASVGPIRKVLFELLGGSPVQAALAAKCLAAIDQLRDDHGLAANDARHPDVHQL